MTSLTERYLAATLRGLPQSKRADVERELRSLIADAVADRIESGEDRAAAEVAVLEGLGDPMRLAAGYAGRPQYLIGPELIEPYRLLLTRLAAVVIPLAAIVLAVLAVANGRTYIQAIVDGVVGAIVIGVQLVFWVTVVFVFIERADAAKETRAEIAGGRWTVAHLPETAPTGVTASDTIGEIVGLLIGIGGILFLRDLSWVNDTSGAPIPLVNPELPGFWVPLLAGLLIALAVLHVVVHIAGRWTMPLAAVYAALNIGFAAGFSYLALNGMLVNRALAAHIGWPTLADGNGVAMLAIAALSTVVTAIEIAQVVRKARRASGPRPVGGLGATSTV